MNSIAIYKILKRVPDTSESEARAVANSIAHINDVATKTDIAELKTELTGLRATVEKTVAYLEEKISTQIAQSEARMTWRMIALAGVIIAAIGLFTKF